MTKKRDPVLLSSNWHVDCRIESDLPEDKVVGNRFLAGMIFGLVALVLVVFDGWLGYNIFTLQHQVQDWDVRLAENRSEARELMRMQGIYREEADKIDRVYGLIKAPLFISGFMASLGESLPPQMNVDVIDSNGTSVIVRGSFQESSASAAALLGSYVEELRKNIRIGPSFNVIKVTGLERSKTDAERSNFEITFYPQPSPRSR